MNSTLFANKGRIGGGIKSPIDGLVAGIKAALNQAGPAFVTKEIATHALSLEGIGDTAVAELQGEVDGLNATMETIFSEHKAAFGSLDVGGKILDKMTEAQKAAGIVAAIASADVHAFLRTPISRKVPATESQIFMPAQGGEFLDKRIPAMEAYDERENKNAIVYSVAYNMQAARQDEFGETFFPTVVVTPDQVGITVSIRLIEVYNEIRRATSGDAVNFGRRNIIQAVIDPTILQNDQTKLYPIVRAESVAHFVAAGSVAPYNVLLDDGTSVSTAPLKLGNTVSLLGISQTDALLETGLMDATDAIDTAVTLANLYLNFTDGTHNDVVQFPTLRLPTAVFNYAPQGNYRLMNLAFQSDALLVNVNTKLFAGGANPVVLAPVVAGNYAVRLSVSVAGSVNLELGDTKLFGADVSVKSITDPSGNVLDPTVGAGATIAALFAGATVLGYDLDARRTNTNRRQRGQLLNTNYYNQIYAVPLRSPITIPRPLTSGDANDSSDLASLITATHVRTSNAAVAELFNTDTVLKDFVNSKDAIANAPALLGVSRFLVTPFYEHDTLDVSTAVDSLTSHQRAADIQAVLVNKLRDIAYRMYRDSGYKAAADALAGGISATPTIIIGTDPVIARYLMVEGDFRTLGPDFQVKVVSTLNNTMKGKIFMSFGDFAGGKEGLPNPMHFGNMAWKPELTLVLPIHRNGGNSKELTVQPSFLHITNLPILARIDVSNIESVIAAKVTVSVSQ